MLILLIPLRFSGLELDLAPKQVVIQANIVQKSYSQHHYTVTVMNSHAEYLDDGRIV